MLPGLCGEKTEKGFAERMGIELGLQAGQDLEKLKGRQGILNWGERFMVKNSKPGIARDIWGQALGVAS